ncbi:HAD-like domain-containing protein [Aspergillus karnatakaensis]|uniref:HAD-like domain-containing protein n=1 Tax=Aspergillus karnatakaensis TaxID=1810916 RepID=UPI003CCDA68E
MRPLLLTLDAFNTLFHPRQPIPAQYASAALSHNISVSPSALQHGFKASYKALSALHPNYGRDLAIKEEYAGPRQWWGDVIRGSFARAISNSDSDKGADVPDALIEDLLERFASARGYKLYDDVGPFFQKLREAQSKSKNQRKIVVGVVSNSDDRITSVLESLGVSVCDARAGEEKTQTNDDLPGFEEEREKEKSRSGSDTRDRSSPLQDQQRDVDFVLTSYQVGAEKPDPLIWDVALRTARRLKSETGDAGGEGGWECIHVGDDYSKDYRGATDAGWKAYYLPRETDAAQVPKGTRTITSLLDLLTELEYK